MRVRYKGVRYELIGSPGEWCAEDGTEVPPGIARELDLIQAQKAMKRAGIKKAGRHELPPGANIDEQRLATLESMVPTREVARRSSGQKRCAMQKMADEEDRDYDVIRRSIARGLQRRCKRQRDRSIIS
jgi:hypothetical protein